MTTAVVVIHGIGEQKPMDTLRRFVDEVLVSEPGRVAYYSTPDPLSELFELRRLQSTGRNSVHFYEYYWAFNVEGTTVREVLLWLGRLALRRREDVPLETRSLWFLSRLLGAAVAILLISGAVAVAHDWFSGLRAFTLTWLLAWIAVVVVQAALVNYLGDAARYLSPLPRNIRLRQEVRAQGIQLLKTLHERGAYDRVVVVGHSLGSVIAYDILTHLWHDSSDAPLTLDDGTRRSVLDCLDHGKPPQPVVGDLLPAAGAALTESGTLGARAAFREQQFAALHEQRRLGQAWCVSDLITVGSPLAHAMLFLATSRADFEARKLQRVLPTCPPQPDVKGYGYAAKVPIEVAPGRLFSPLHLHHGSPFAVTRWTNLYVPARWGLFGDLVGGPVAPALGPGVRDVAVRTGAWRGWADLTPAAHVHYWTRPRTDSRRARRSDLPLALDELRAALELEYRGSRVPQRLQRTKPKEASS